MICPGGHSGDDFLFCLVDPPQSTLRKLGLGNRVHDVGDANSEGETRGADTFTFESKASETLVCWALRGPEDLAGHDEGPRQSSVSRKGHECLEDPQRETPHFAHQGGDHFCPEEQQTEHTDNLKVVGNWVRCRLWRRRARHSRRHCQEDALADTATISELAKNLEWQDATRVSVIDFFSPLWTKVFVCFLNLRFCNEPVHG